MRCHLKIKINDPFTESVPGFFFSFFCRVKHPGRTSRALLLCNHRAQPLCARGTHGKLEEDSCAVRASSAASGPVSAPGELALPAKPPPFLSLASYYVASRSGFGAFLAAESGPSLLFTRRDAPIRTPALMSHRFELLGFHRCPPHTTAFLV